MISGCDKITILELYSFKTKNVIIKSDMFDQFKTFKILNFSKYDTSKQTNINENFY